MPPAKSRTKKKKGRGRPRLYGPSQLLAIRLPEEMHQRLREISAKTERSMTRLVVEAVEQWLERADDRQGWRPRVRRGRP